jgi:hypothetical protein
MPLDLAVASSRAAPETRDPEDRQREPDESNRDPDPRDDEEEDDSDDDERDPDADHESRLPVRPKGETSYDWRTTSRSSVISRIV